MAVAPDLLLSGASEVRSRTAAPKPAAQSTEARGNEASSFARVLADERQAKTGEVRNADNRAAADKAAGEHKTSNAGAAEADAQSQVADSGNPLPASVDDLVPDPLALLGLGDEAVQEGVAGETDGDQATDEVDIGLLAADTASAEPPSATLPPTAGAVPVVSSGPVIDPEIEKLNSAASVQLSLDMAKKAQAEQVGKTAVGGVAGTTPAALSSGGGEAALKALGGLNPEAEVEPELEALPMELADTPLDALKESAADSRPDSAASRLNLLGQAITQAAQAQRTLVPGQPVAMQQGGWSEAVVDRVMWLSSQNLKSAEIQLDPAELGRLDVRISLNQDQAQVTFSSPHAQVREALESQMYRMREMFAQQGMNQLDVNVSDQSLARNFQGQQDADHSRRGGVAGGAGGEADDALPLNDVRALQPATLRGLVDFYA